jgi:hypothetical protein
MPLESLEPSGPSRNESKHDDEHDERVNQCLEAVESWNFLETEVRKSVGSWNMMPSMARGAAIQRHIPHGGVHIAHPEGPNMIVPQYRFV